MSKTVKIELSALKRKFNILVVQNKLVTEKFNFALFSCIAAVQKFREDLEIASHIQTEFERNFGAPGWVCIVSEENLGNAFKLYSEKDNYIVMKFHEKFIILFFIDTSNLIFNPHMLLVGCLFHYTHI